MTEKDKTKIKLESIRTKLAIKQTMMSCERSLLSYISTACVFVSLAFTYLKIASYDKFDWFVIIMFVIGLSFLVFGLIEYFIVKSKTKRTLKRLEYDFNDVDESIKIDDLEV